MPFGLVFCLRTPARQVKPPRPQSCEVKILDKGEIATVISAAKGTGLYVPVLVAVTTGVRRGELLALRWSDIDLKASTLTVNQSLERIKGKFEFKAPKTKTSRRTISLPAVTVEALREHYRAQLEERLSSGLGETIADSCSRAPMANHWTPTHSANLFVGLS
jgi:integrase